MNDFSAKKLGEVVAFCEVGAETLERGKEALEGRFDESVERMIEAHKAHATEFLRIAQTFEKDDITKEKAAATRENKLEQMRALYLSEDDWEDATELMEWMGFFEGATIVHLRVIEGVAEKLESDELKNATDETIAYHEKLLERVGEIIKETTADRIEG